MGQSPLSIAFPTPQSFAQQPFRPSTTSAPNLLTLLPRKPLGQETLHGHPSHPLWLRLWCPPRVLSRLFCLLNPMQQTNLRTLILGGQIPSTRKVSPFGNQLAGLLVLEQLRLSRLNPPTAVSPSTTGPSSLHHQSRNHLHPDILPHPLLGTLPSIHSFRFHSHLRSNDIVHRADPSNGPPTQQPRSSAFLRWTNPANETAASD